MSERQLVDPECPNDGDCDTCGKKETCTNKEAQESLNRALQELKVKKFLALPE